MAEDNEVDSVIMSIRNSSGNIVAASVAISTISLRLLSFLLRMAKKGLVSLRTAKSFTAFMEKSEGEYGVYNVPLSEESIGKYNELRKGMETASDPKTKKHLQKEMDAEIRKIPEVKQLEKLGITYNVLPKLNGNDHTLQVAIADKDSPKFKNWYLNHLQTHMIGNEMSEADLSLFTEGSYSIVKVPFEQSVKDKSGNMVYNSQYDAMLSDFHTLKINYAQMPDLNIEDGKTHVAVANLDVQKVKYWLERYREKTGCSEEEAAVVSTEEYASTGKISEEQYVRNADPDYIRADKEFEDKSSPPPWTASLVSDKSEEFLLMEKTKGWEKISINRESLVDKYRDRPWVSEMEERGYFVSRIPGRYGGNEEFLVIPRENAYSTDDDKTVIAFLPEGRSVNVADKNGEIRQEASSWVAAYYNKVERGFGRVENLKQSAGVPQKQEVSVPVQVGVQIQESVTPSAAKTPAQESISPSAVKNPAQESKIPSTAATQAQQAQKASAANVPVKKPSPSVPKHTASDIPKPKL